MRRVSSVILGIALLVFISCVTVNIYFPAAEAQKTAREITEEVRGTPQHEKEGEKPRSFHWIGIAYAQPELEVSNATIRVLKDSMKKRYPLLKSYLSSGVLGESLDGYLTVKDVSHLSLRDKATVKRLMKAENKERSMLYKAVAQALSISPKQIPRLRKIFAKEWQRTAPPGTWMEVEPGKWVSKK